MKPETLAYQAQIEMADMADRARQNLVANETSPMAKGFKKVAAAVELTSVLLAEMRSNSVTYPPNVVAAMRKLVEPSQSS